MNLQEHILSHPNEPPADTVAWWIAELDKEPKDYKMVDVTMCSSEECSRRSSCYRSRYSGTVPDEYQSTTLWDHNTCSMYWPVEKKKDLKKLINDYLEHGP